MAQSSRSRRPWEEPLTSALKQDIHSSPGGRPSPPQTLSPTTVDRPTPPMPGPRVGPPTKWFADLKLPELDMQSSAKRKRVEPPSAIERKYNSPISLEREHFARCCSPTCGGPHCARIRQIIHYLQSEMSAHEILVHGSASEPQSPPHLQQTRMAAVPVLELLEKQAARLQQSNLALRQLLDFKNASAPSPRSALDRQQQQQQQQQQHRFEVHHQGAHFSGQTSPAARVVLKANQAPPSPMSIGGPFPANTPHSPAPPPPPSHTAHLHDLQRQLSAKSAAHAALQREHEALRERLERQRARAAQLERRSEAADAELAGLASDRERLREARDEARRSAADSAAQYLRIVENAGRIRAGGSAAASPAAGGSGGEERRAWEEERERLVKRVEELEKGVKAEEDNPAEDRGDSVKKLEDDLRRLRLRNCKLEEAILAGKQAALTFAAQGQSLSATLGAALD